MIIKNVFFGLWQLLFPPACTVCRIRLAPGSVSALCPSCRERLVFLKPPFCALCGVELAGDADRSHRCGDCLRRPPPFTLARSLLRYEHSVALLLRRLKYHGDTSVLPAIGELLTECKLDEFADCRVIVPVPLHLHRHRQRGLNQAAVLAHAFFPDKDAGVCRDLLIRIRNTPAQTTLSGQQRRRNLDGAFGIRPGMSVTGVVCLVDDVYTTGSTVSACAKVLFHHGAEEVRVLTLARAARPR
jgi:ComF family protein